ncbi:BamA/TamA family outer membrane protein [Flavitalea antarctica]
MLFILLINWQHSNAQKTKKPISLRDSVDHGFDLSDFIIDANGFVPIPYLITDRALGGFGGAIIPVFIKKRPGYIDSVDGRRIRTAVAPDITGGLAAYTANNTWAFAAFRSGNFIKSRIKYTIGGGYANVNMSFYRDLAGLGEKEFRLSIKTIPALLQVTKRIGVTRWFAGAKYMFLNTDITYAGDTILSNLAKTFEFNSTVSQLGAIIEFDDRDNVFTPDKGIRFKTEFNWSDNILGSDFDFWRINYYGYFYHSLGRQFTGGLRLDGQQNIGDAPFFLLPAINMRGVPAYRYQGEATLLSELEFRYDFVHRWSAVAFGGAGKAFDSWKQFGSSDWILTYGSGFRYLLARKFKLRVGIDVAKGAGLWSYYIVFGSNWVK